MIFLDTSFLFPLFARHDPDHQRVREVMEGYRGKQMAEHVLTTNHVVAETITLVRYKGSRQSEAALALATEVGSALYAGALARIYWSTPEDERAAFEFFKRYADQEYSMVDCLSFVVMEQQDIREAFAVDSDFTHRFVARPGPAR